MVLTIQAIDLHWQFITFNKITIQSKIKEKSFFVWVQWEKYSNVNFIRFLVHSFGDRNKLKLFISCASAISIQVIPMHFHPHNEITDFSSNLFVSISVLLYGSRAKNAIPKPSSLSFGCSLRYYSKFNRWNQHAGYVRILIHVLYSMPVNGFFSFGTRFYVIRHTSY